MVSFGVCYAIASFAGSNTPALLAFMMCGMFKMSERIYEQERAMTDLKDHYDNQLERIYNALSNTDDKIERKFNRTLELYEKTLPPKHIDDDYF